MEKHLALPMEWEPERATRSLIERLKLAKRSMREVALARGLGMMLFESSWLAVRLSCLPNFTSQWGPPLWFNMSRNVMWLIYEFIYIDMANISQKNNVKLCIWQPKIK